MSFSRQMAKKYITTQKRHSVLTIISIGIAVAFIMVIFNLFSTYRYCSGNIVKSVDPWHGIIYNLTKEQEKTFTQNKIIESFKHEEHIYTAEDGSKKKYFQTHFKFSKDTEDCKEDLEKALKTAGVNTNALTDGWSSDKADAIGVYLNQQLIEYDMIGLDAKMVYVQLVAAAFIWVLFVAFCARFIIDTAFEISSKEKEKQFGILQSLGASKKQITKIILWEGGYLSIAGVPIGLVFGTIVSYIIYLIVLSTNIAKNIAPENTDIDSIVGFKVSPVLVLLTAVTGVVWALLSAYGVGVRTAKKSPIDAIKSKAGSVKKVKKFSLLGKLFSWYGKLASRNIRRNKKRFVITIISATLSIALFVSVSFVITIMMNFFESQFEVMSSDFSISKLSESVNESYINKEGPTKPSDYKKVQSILENSECLEKVYADLLILSSNKDIDFSYTDEYKRSGSSHYISNNAASIYCVSEKFYNELFNGKPPVPYSKLDENNGVFINKIAVYESDDSLKRIYIKAVNNIKKGDNLKFTLKDYTVTKKKYDELLKKEVEKKTKDEIKKDINVLYTADNISDENALFFFTPTIITSQKAYDKELYKYSVFNQKAAVFSANLKDGHSKDEVTKLLKDNKLIMTNNDYDIREQTKSILVTFQIIGWAFTLFVSMIAVINMMNVISTGMVNRRQELASMMSVGMSKKQMNRMVVIECLQYTIISGVFALILIGLIYYATFGFGGEIIGLDMSSISDMTVEPFVKSLAINYPIALLISFAVGMLSSFIPLKHMRKESITEVIRDIE